MLIASHQATRLRALLGQTKPAADLSWLVGGFENVEVVVEPLWRMDKLSGFSKWADGHWLIGVNKSHTQARRRFTLAHEFKHILDANRDKITYQGISDQQREWIADYFAACYLMPKLSLRRAWTSGLQDPEALAGLFKVSRQAMDRRLSYLGYVDDEPDRAVATYFRGLHGWLHDVLATNPGPRRTDGVLEDELDEPTDDRSTGISWAA